MHLFNIKYYVWKSVVQIMVIFILIFKVYYIDLILNINNYLFKFKRLSFMKYNNYNFKTII